MGDESYNISSGFLGLLNVYSHNIVFYFSGLVCGGLQLPFFHTT